MKPAPNMRLVTLLLRAPLKLLLCASAFAPFHFPSPCSTTPSEAPFSSLHLSMLLLWAFIHILTSLPLLTFSAQAKNICYFPDAQTVDVNGYACNLTAQFSSCCSRNDSCVAGGLCFGNFGFLYRQSCTDPTFKDPSCPQACVNCEYNSSKTARWVGIG
jgi:hypothetical protein